MRKLGNRLCILLGEQTPPPTRITLEQLGTTAETTWNFRFSRTLVLFDRVTNLLADRTPLADQLANLNGAEAASWLTFKRNFTATSWADEPIHDTAQGHTISRPFDLDGYLMTAQIGVIDNFGFLSGLSPDYAITPGWTNLIWLSPEPPMAGLVIGAIALFYTRRPSMMTCYGRRHRNEPHKPVRPRGGCHRTDSPRSAG